MTALPALQRAINKVSAVQTQIQNLLATQSAQAAQITSLEASVAGIAATTISTVVKTSDQLNIGTAFADITDLSFALAANSKYYFRFVVLLDADAATTGIDVAVNGPAATTVLNYTQTYWTSATAQAYAGATAYDNNTASANSNGTSVRAFVVEGVIHTGGTAGNLVARAKREAVGAGPHARTGSCGVLWFLG